MTTTEAAQKCRVPACQGQRWEGGNLCDAHQQTLDAACRTAQVSRPETPTLENQYLYRYFDVDDRLLYVGVTTSLAERHKAHARLSPWFGEHVRKMVEGYDTRWDVLQAESYAIRTERPLHNRAA